MIAIEEVRKTFGQVTVLDGVSLRVEAGRRTALVGRSGAGKSTMLRIILGLVQPDSGAVTVCGTRAAPDNVQRLRLRIGYVIQDGGLFPHLTADENAALVARELGWARDRIEARAAELFDLAGLPRSLGALYPRQLSGGQKQRVGLVRALMLDPDVLLLDEPLGALDPVLRARMQRDLVALFARLGKTVLLITHDLAEAAHLADEIAVLSSGRIVQRGQIGELAARPADAFVEELVRSGAAIATPETAR